MAGLIVFSDLDGTLLDHRTYAFDPARPALDRLVRLGVPLVLASSKTALEMRPLQAAMGLPRWPMICENGAGVVADEDADRSEYHRLRRTLEKAPLRARFRGFGDMTVDEVSRITGLPLTAAQAARERAFSEPGLWTGSAAERRAFVAALAEHGISVRSGGRFLTLSFGGTKADRMAAIMAQLGRDRSIALGDAPNDAEMLDFADIGVIIENPDAPPVPARSRTLIRSTMPGPEGWNLELTRLLDEAGFPE